jgi:SEC-C motif
VALAEKLGRNQPCWCGSGSKYKKCHLYADEAQRSPPPRAARSPPINWKAVDTMIERRRAEEARREALQGKGRGIISAEIKDQRLVAVGNSIYYAKSDQTKTFADFLGRYLKMVLKPEWGNAEIARAFEQRHPLLQWYDALSKLQAASPQAGEIKEFPSVGLVTAYYSLAYNLYLLQHNAEVQNHLVERLKRPESFLAALYETHVAAWFILAGLKLSLENESDGSSTHCEFVAEARSGHKFSVEAKCRQPNKNNLAIGNQLAKALKKVANHPRIVCIELSVRQEVIGADQDVFIAQMVERVRSRETALTIDGQPAPPAYLFVTNMPHHLHLHDDGAQRALLAEGFKIPDFGSVEYPSLTAAYRARLKHADVYSVAEAFRQYKVPSTFDGELPEFAFGQAERRFIVGDQHQMDDGFIGVLEQGIVSENEKTAYLVYNGDGRRVIYNAPLTDAELSAYKRHPETFFGKIADVGKQLTSTLDLYAFIYESYKNTPREKILEWLAKSPELEALAKLPNEELRYAYVERTVIGVIHKNPPKDVRFRAR